jgi:hypothetical protein
MLNNYPKYNEIVQYNTVIENAFPEYNFYPSILQIPIKDGAWNMSLPRVKNSKGIVLHTQDNLNIRHDGSIPELCNIEKFYKNANIDNIVVIHWNHNLNEIYNGPLKLIEFPTHSFEFVQNFSNRRDEWEHVKNKTKDYNFMCLNGNPRKHRKLLYDYLISLDINSLTTLSTDNKSNKHTDVLKYANYNFDNTQNFINLAEIYKSTAVNIVSETMYYEPCGIITEKTLQAFGALQLPLIIGHCGAVSDARNCGFDMFDDIIDNSYDDLPNEIRWKSAIDLNMHVLHNKFKYEELMPRLLKNQNYICSGYAEYLLNSVNTQVNALLN